MNAFKPAGGARRISIDPPEGGQIVGVLAEPTERSRGAVVLAPGYERQIYHYAALSRVLIEHGYSTLRFDLRNHLGLSAGEVSDFNMTSVAEDIDCVMRFGAASFDVDRCALIAPSLAARGAVRVLSGEVAASLLLAIIPVVDVRFSLAQMMGEDLLPKWESGEVSDPERLVRLGRQEVKASAGRDVLEGDWGGLDQPKVEAAAIDCPVFAVAAEHDEWVKSDDVPVVLEGESAFRRACMVVETSSHNIGQNFPVMRLILQIAVEQLNGVHGVDEAPRVPDFQQLAGVMVSERRWARDGYETDQLAEAAA
jgi:pimeloyl-ACP methyl ester carboxylesterase